MLAVGGYPRRLEEFEGHLTTQQETREYLLFSALATGFHVSPLVEGGELGS